MAPKFYGPYQIIRKISSVTYELKLQDKSQIHHLFHILNLKKVLGQHQTAQMTLPTFDEEGKLVLEPEVVIDIKERRLCSRIIKEYLVKWKNCPKEDASWETKKFWQQYSSLPFFEDKAS